MKNRIIVYLSCAAFAAFLSYLANLIFNMGIEPKHFFEMALFLMAIDFLIYLSKKDDDGLR